jgi:broad specificity phosphatase PhoE
MAKILVLIRHGQRDNSQPSLDNGLNDKGKEQARMLRRFFSARFQPDDLKRGVWIVSSPKKRCIETLTPLAKSIERPVDIHPDLIEQDIKETSADQIRRIQHFLKEWKESKAELTILCSHGDWLPMATQQILGLPIGFKKGAWVEIHLDDGVFELRWVIPSFKALFSE